MASTSPVRIKLTDFGISKSTINTNLRTTIGTEGYMAPELLRMLPTHLRLGGAYTNAVDMWALGCLVYKIYTLEVPFMRSVQTTAMSESGIVTSTFEETDAQLLINFCKGNVDLPISCLEECGVSREGIGFIKDLLVAHPTSRISAADAMKLRWILGLPIDEYENIKSQFSTLGVHLSLGATEILLKQWEKSKGTSQPTSPVVNKPGFLGELDISGLSPLMVNNSGALMHAAASEGYTTIVDIMSYIMPIGKEGIDFRINGWTALQSAAKGGHIDVVKLLLEKKAKINASPYKEQGRTALQAASQGGHPEVVRLLLDEKAQINAKPSYNAGRGALQAAAEGGSLEVVNLLLERGADVNTPPCKMHGRTALQAAAEKGQLELVRLLMEKGAKVDAEPCDVKGRTALQAAAENGHLEVVQFLLERGAEINAEPCEVEGRTALQAAAEGGHCDVVQVLLEMGADVNAEPCSEGGATALSAAIAHGHLKVEELLCAAGAEPYDA